MSKDKGGYQPLRGDSIYIYIYIHIYYSQNMVIIVPADVVAHNGARPSAGTCYNDFVYFWLPHDTSHRKTGHCFPTVLRKSIYLPEQSAIFKLVSHGLEISSDLYLRHHHLVNRALGRLLYLLCLYIFSTIDFMDYQTSQIHSVYVFKLSDRFAGHNINGLVQGCSISTANTLQILQSCAKPSLWICMWDIINYALQGCRDLLTCSIAMPYVAAQFCEHGTVFSLLRTLMYAMDYYIHAISGSDMNVF